MLILGGKDDSAEYTLGIKVLGIKGVETLVSVTSHAQI